MMNTCDSLERITAKNAFAVIRVNPESLSNEIYESEWRIEEQNEP
jgi:hypothetical protein